MLSRKPLLLCALAALLMGCAEKTIPLHQVEGTVMLDGKPLDRIAVNFWPQTEGPRSHGVTDENGRFVLSTYGTETTEKGAVADTHKVVLADNSVFKEGIEKLSAAEIRAADDLVVGKSRIHPKYTNIRMTPLEVTIDSDTKDVTLEVEPPESQTGNQ